MAPVGATERCQSRRRPAAMSQDPVIPVRRLKCECTTASDELLWDGEPQLLGSCQSVVESLGALRNKLGDAHGGGPKKAKPAARHAELAVNLSGSMCTFLVATWEARKLTNPSRQ